MDIWVDGRKRGQAPCGGRTASGAPFCSGCRARYAPWLQDDVCYRTICAAVSAHGSAWNGKHCGFERGVSSREALYRAPEHTQTELILVAVEGESGALNLHLYSTLSSAFRRD